jgi:glycosyltransferase involved in cell wall biosynthesis
MLDLAAELSALGVGVDLFTIRPLNLDEVPHQEGASVDGRLSLTDGGLPVGRRYRYRVLRLGARLLRSARRADVVLSGWDIGSPLVAAFASGKAAGKPVLVMVAGHPVRGLERSGGWTKRATEWIYPRLDGAVCHSKGQVPIVSSLGLSREQISVISHGITLERIRASAAESVPDWVPRDEPFLLSAGRLHSEKRYDDLIEAHARVLASGLPHKLVILGQGPEQEALEALVARLGLSESVLMPGFVQNPFPVFARATLFCLCSEYEGWSLVLTEALALGVPLLSTDVLSGPAQILGGGRYGQLVEPGSVDALAGAIERHLREPEVLRAKAREGVRHAESFTVRARAEAHARLFRDLSHGGAT